MWLNIPIDTKWSSGNTTVKCYNKNYFINKHVWLCAWNWFASPLRIQGKQNGGDLKTTFLRWISLETKQQRLEQKERLHLMLLCKIFCK